MNKNYVLRRKTPCFSWGIKEASAKADIFIKPWIS